MRDYLVILHDEPGWSSMAMSDHDTREEALEEIRLLIQEHPDWDFRLEIWTKEAYNQVRSGSDGKRTKS